MYGLNRNPFYPKYFLSAGDWSVRVWNEDLRTPVTMSRYMPAHLTGCRWSPSRCGINGHTREEIDMPMPSSNQARRVHHNDNCCDF